MPCNSLKEILKNTWTDATPSPQLSPWLTDFSIHFRFLLLEVLFDFKKLIIVDKLTQTKGFEKFNFNLKRIFLFQFVMSSASLLCLQWDKWLLTKFCPRNQITPMLVVSISILLGSAIYNSAFWELKVSLAVTRGFLEIVMILVTFPGYLLFWGYLWTEKILLDEKTVVFVAPLNLVLMLLASSSTSCLLGVSGLAMATWLMGFKFTLQKDHPLVNYYHWIYHFFPQVGLLWHVCLRILFAHFFYCCEQNFFLIQTMRFALVETKSWNQKMWL